jgi:hypothetical protein
MHRTRSHRVATASWLLATAPPRRGCLPVPSCCFATAPQLLHMAVPMKWPGPRCEEMGGGGGGLDLKDLAMGVGEETGCEQEHRGESGRR